MICDDITAKVTELLSGISKTDGYLTDAGAFVHDQPLAHPDENITPWIGVDYESLELPQDSSGGMTKMTLIIEVLASSEVKSPDIVEDVIRVLKANKNLVEPAAEFFPQSVRKQSEQEQYRVGYCALRFTVNYITTDEWEF